MQLNLQGLAEESLKLEPSLEAKQLVVRITGACDGFAVAPLGAYLNRVLEEMERLDLREVSFDVQSLQLFNSSCLKQFISFLHRVRSDVTLRHVNFLVDPNQSWQKRSVRAFARMCPGIVRVVPAVLGESDPPQAETG